MLYLITAAFLIAAGFYIDRSLGQFEWFKHEETQRWYRIAAPDPNRRDYTSLARWLNRRLLRRLND